MKKGTGFFYGWVILAVAFITMVLGYGIRNNFSVFYPTIVEEFGWSRGNTALMFSIAILVYGLVAPLAGSMVDRFGPRLVFPMGSFIVGGSIALCSLATAQWHFYLLYGVVAAIGLSIMGLTPLMAIVSKWFVKKRGLVFGILSAGFGLGLVSAPAVQFLISRMNKVFNCGDSSNFSEFKRFRWTGRMVSIPVLTCTTQLESCPVAQAGNRLSHFVTSSLVSMD